MIKIAVNKTSITYVDGREELTAGRVGLDIQAEFSAEWSGLTKIAVASGSGTELDTTVSGDGTFTVPHECMETPGGQLKVGIYGMSEDGKIVIPTVYCVLGVIRDGATPAGESGTEYTPSLFDQIVLAAKGYADDAAASAASIDGAISVTQYSDGLVPRTDWTEKLKLSSDTYAWVSDKKYSPGVIKNITCYTGDTETTCTAYFFRADGTAGTFIQEFTASGKGFVEIPCNFVALYDFYVGIKGKGIKFGIVKDGEYNCASESSSTIDVSDSKYKNKY